MQNLPVAGGNGFDLTAAKSLGVLFSLSVAGAVLHKGFSKIGGISEMQKKKKCQGCYFHLTAVRGKSLSGIGAGFFFRSDALWNLSCEAV